jgi:ADP-heptose:LPS heptosyltransferase
VKNRGSKLRPHFTAAERAGYFALSLFITLPTVLVGRILRKIRSLRRTSESAPRNAVQAVLVILVQQLGDIIVSSGYLRSLRNLFPTATITLVVDNSFLEYASRCPHVDEVLGVHLSRSKYLRAFVGPVDSFQFVRRNLKNRFFDLVLNSRWDVDSRHAGFLGMFADSRKYVGFSSHSTPRKRLMNRWLDLAFTDTFSTTKIVHDAERGLDLLRFLNYDVNHHNSEIWLDKAGIQFATRSLSDKDTNIIAFGIGASEAKRRWPISRFLSLAERMLSAQLATKFLIVGNKEDGFRARELSEKLGDAVLNFAGQCNVSQSAALLSRCRLFVGNDSGPMHMAAALGTPVVEISCHPWTGSLSHANAPERYYPLVTPHRILRPNDFSSPCSDVCYAPEPHCILSNSVNAVAEAVFELLAIESPSILAPLRRLG